MAMIIIIALNTKLWFEIVLCLARSCLVPKSARQA